MRHVDDLIWDWLVQDIPEDQARELEEHLAQCVYCQATLDAHIRLLAVTATRAVTGRANLLQSATTLARFERWAEPIASLADVAASEARDWLARIDDPEAWSPTALGALELFHIEGGPRVERAVIGFVRLAPGTGFPEHTHLGREQVFVIQGRLRDENGDVHGPGSLVEREEGLTHEIFAEPGPPLVYLSIVQEGVEIFGMRFGPDSPEM